MPHRTLGNMQSFCVLFVWGREKVKRASEARLVNFPAVRNQKPTSGFPVQNKKREHTAVSSRSPTVTSFSLASLHTSRTIQVCNGKNPNFDHAQTLGCSFGRQWIQIFLRWKEAAGFLVGRGLHTALSWKKQSWSPSRLQMIPSKGNLVQY